MGLIPSQETKIPHEYVWPEKENKNMEWRNEELGCKATKVKTDAIVLQEKVSA